MPTMTPYSIHSRTAQLVALACGVSEDAASSLLGTDGDVLGAIRQQPGGRKRKLRERLSAAVELGRLTLQPVVDPQKSYKTPRALAEVLIPEYGHRTVEHFGVALLDGRHHLVASEVVALGTVNQASVHPLPGRPAPQRRGHRLFSQSPVRRSGPEQRRYLHDTPAHERRGNHGHRSAGPPRSDRHEIHVPARRRRVGSRIVTPPAIVSTCPACHGEGTTDTGRTCRRCHGSGLVASAPVIVHTAKSAERTSA